MTDAPPDALSPAYPERKPMTAQPTQFRDLSEFYNPDLNLPVHGKVYTIAAPSATDGLKLHRCYDPQFEATTEQQLAEMMKLLGAHPIDDGTPQPDYEGGLFDEMQADGLGWAEIYRVGQTAMLYYGLGPDLAKAYWRKPTVNMTGTVESSEGKRSTEVSDNVSLTTQESGDE